MSTQIREYNEKHKHEDLRIDKVLKPFSDVYSLSKKTGLNKIQHETKRENARRIRNVSANPSIPHSADGMLLEIAGILLKRANRLRNEQDTVQDLVHASLLALEAKELLGGKTPALSLEALGIQHRYEVLTECSCYGTDYELNVKERATDIRKEVELIGKWYHPGKYRTFAELSAQSKILGDLSTIYADFKQVDELQQCLVETRKLSGLLYMHHHPWAWPLYPFRWYFEFLQRSFKHFAIAVICWLIGLLAIWSWYFYSLQLTVGDLLFSFFNQLFALQTPSWLGDDRRLATVTLLIAPPILNMTHIIFLITDIFSRIQRK